MTEDRFTPPEVIAALEAAGGIDSGAATRLGCTPETIRAYRETYPEVAAVGAEVRLKALDMAETHLLAAVQKGEPWAVRYYLEMFGGRRGYFPGGPRGGLVRLEADSLRRLSPPAEPIDLSPSEPRD